MALAGPFGWTWVNDEPWGWATYHHGRWFFHDGYWNWSPYGYYRTSRSWWRPALVVITIVRNNICWYPLRYHQAHYNYNRHRDRRPPRGGGTNGGGNPPIQPIPGRETVGIVGRVKGGGQRPVDGIPPSGVNGVEAKDFGKGFGGVRRMPREVAETALDPRTLDRIHELPKRESLVRGMGREILAEPPRRDLRGAEARVGAAKRNHGAPLDGELRNTRVFGGRPPGREVPPTDTERRQPRQTGIFERPVQPRLTPPSGERPPRTVDPVRTPSPKESPGLEPQPKGDVIRRVPRQPRDTPRYDPPPQTENPRRTPPQPKESPRKDPPAEREKPRTTTPSVKETPKSDPPPAKDPPRSERPASPSRKADPIT